jgi:hypothetical protein
MILGGKAVHAQDESDGDEVDTMRAGRRAVQIHRAARVNSGKPILRGMRLLPESYQLPATATGQTNARLSERNSGKPSLRGMRLLPESYQLPATATGQTNARLSERNSGKTLRAQG